MGRYKLVFVFIQAISFCLCEIDFQRKNKLVNGFVEFYNRLPNEIYRCDEGYLQSAQQTDITNAFDINVNLRVSDTHNPDIIKYLKCTATVADVDIIGVAVMKHQCQEDLDPGENPANIEEKVTAEPDVVTEEAFVRRPIQLDNEVQTDTAVTSGEQFIAIPREEPKVHCIGCSFHVNPQAQGVSELAAIGVRQLNSLEPNIQHTLTSVVDVERQVQVVNGVRYILTLLIDYNSCSAQETDLCLTSKACKITILEKPWVQLPDGSKYRAILSNNCTEEWRFGDNGVVIPPSDNKENNNINQTYPDGGSDIINAVHNVDVQSLQKTEKSLTEQDIKTLEDQIIPFNQLSPGPAVTESASTTPLPSVMSKEHVVKVESENQHSPNSIQASKPQKVENLDDDKKKSIDELLSFFDFAGFELNTNHEQAAHRLKRSFENDLNVLNLAEKFKKVKKNIENAKHIYTLAQAVVDYLNEGLEGKDLEVNDIVLKDVTSAEEESENGNTFYYIQFRTIVPCKTSYCKAKDTVIKICNAVIENSEKLPQILNVFCHDEDKRNQLEKIYSVPRDDPVLLKLIQESIIKIESDSKNDKAIKLIKVIDANTQRVSGTLTKVSILLERTDCDKSVHFKLRTNCSVVEEYGSLICDVTVHERHWLKERAISYSCTERPIDTKFSKIRKNSTAKSPDDPAVRDMVQDALHKLEMQSKRNNKQLVVKVNSVSTQIVAGFLTNIEFIVGYTNCPTYVNTEKSAECTLLENEPLKTCTAKVWDRTWIEDGRQVEVSCEETNTESNKITKKVKRSNGLTGGVMEKNVNDPEIKTLVKDSLQKFLQTFGGQTHYDVIEIEQATVQVVAGAKYNLRFKISPTDCQINSDGKPTSSECKIINSEDTTTCSSVVWHRPWLNKKDIEVSCRIDDANVRIKRQLPGGVKDEDPNMTKYKQLAQESLQKYLQDTGNSQPHKVVRVEKVSTQVVAGSKTIIEFKITPDGQTTNDEISCKSIIVERKWLNEKEIEVNCQINDNKRVKRSTFVGGKLDKDPNDPKYKKLADESLDKYLQSSGNSQPHRVVSVDKVTAQVVSGLITKIFFKISPKAQNTADVINCNSVIWEKPWINFKEINVTCSVDAIKKREKRNIITGGFVEQDPKNPHYKQLAEVSLKKYLQDSGISQVHEVIKIEKVITQVVSGLRTIIDFNIAPKSSTSGNFISCQSEIWQQHWQDTDKITVNCEQDNNITRKKRETFDEKRNKRNTSDKWGLGGQQQEDPTKAEFRELAEDAFRKYQKKQNKTKNHVIVEVKKVTTKVVAGIIYTIDFTAAPKSCADDVSICDESNPLLNCHTVVLHRPWLLQKDIEVSCRSKRKRNKRETNLKEAEVNAKFDQPTEVEILDLDERGKRQAGVEDDYVDEDTRFYYADRAIQKLNDQSRSNNLYKLITIHTAQSSMHMDNTPMVRMYIEAAETYCLRHQEDKKLSECEELDGNNHKLCLARLWPSPDDEMVIQTVSVVCDDDEKFEGITGLSIPVLLKASIKSIEQSSRLKYKLVHQGEPQLIPTLDSSSPIKLNFIIRTTNCSKHVDNMNKHNCFIDGTKPSKACSSFIWLVPNSRTISKLTTSCAQTEFRSRRSVPLHSANATADDLEIQKMVKESLEKLEMTSPQRYKQKVLKINSYSTKVTSGKVTTINFDVAFTSCLKYEWVDDIDSCVLLEHLPKRHCIAEIWERLWLDNGRNIEVTCEDEEAPLETHVEFGSATVAMALANRALKHIEAKYPHPRKQKVVRIYSMDKQVVAGVHYRMKMEVGLTNCSALSGDDYCVIDKKAGGENKFCRVNVWVRPWTDHPPNFRVTCDYQEGAMADLYHQIQAEHLFRDFLATYTPEYINDHDEMLKKFEVFKANIRRIHELNTHERGSATYGVTRFADLTYEEFTKKHTGLKPSLRNVNQVPMRKAQIPNVDVPEMFDWRKHGAVTEVKDQGSCGSCWAFSVTGNIEGQWQLKSGKLVPLSEQELVDCDKMDDGCNGGLPDNAYRAIEQLGGLETEDDYPYEGENDKCAFNKSLSRVQITGAVNITTNETDMAKWLVAKGPISIGINANAMQFYMGGVSHPWKMLCSPSNLDHGVLIVGYGIKNYPLFHKRIPYWIVKNSWGPSWGEQGYYRVYRGDGTCGVNQMASSAII